MKNLFFIQKNLFIISLISSMMICLSSNSFMSMWMSMEINLFSFIPLISSNQKIMSEKSTMLYFLIQSISSSIFLISFSMNLENLKSMMTTMMILAIFMKLGMFPFHFWMISIIEGMEWEQAFILMTLQKIIPIMILSFMTQQKMIIMFWILNSLIACISGLTMFSTRKILGFSSINHLSIMLMAMILSKKIFKAYFIIYSFMTFSATKMMKTTNLNFLFQSFTEMKKNKANNFTFLLIFLSMAGVPPLLGFMPKMLTLMAMLKSEMFLTITLILIFNTLSTFFYLRMSMNNLLMNSNFSKTKLKTKELKLPLYLIFSPMLFLSF
uniref:NADH-ubiquinone oxidoreductase chain 2 n=1 Tax=Thrips imaginis TaxID=159957 RepID=Q8HQ05_THRIM|nr:NADH dehydrogenase subunit 2 [Thrips imaginis]